MNSSVELTPCTDGTFCCGHNNLTCCGTEWAINVPTQAVVTDATETTVVTQVTNGGPGIAAVAGLGIGLGVVMLVAAGIIYYLTRQRKQLKKQNQELKEASTAAFSDPHRVSYLPGS